MGYYMDKIYLIQMEEVVVDEECDETIQVWEDFYDETTDLEEAKKNAKELLEKIKKHEIEEVLEAEDISNDIAVCIAVYDAKDSSILDVIDVGNVKPDVWNVKCGDCGAYCTEGTCFKYGHRVDEDQIAESCWHKL